MEETTRATAHLGSIALCGFLAGCAALAGSPATSPHAHWRAHAWPLPQCPSSPLRAPAAGPALLAGAVADLALDRIATALNAAAAADREGVAWAGTDARYLWFGQATGGASIEAPVAALAGCIIVALTDRGDADPSRWCAAYDAAPAAGRAFARACTNDGRRLLELASRDVPGGASPTGIGLPHLYAEVRLRPSRDGAAITPEVVALHYPQALQARQDATRDLAFTLQLRLPEETKGANLLVLLRDITPGQMSDESAPDFIQDATLWTAAPAFPGGRPVPADIGAGIGPVNIGLEIRETGDTNAFLQALTAAFNGLGPAFSKALK
ncbi:MAG: hypothetical protein CMLOHMNK_00961 [Steroidobacteraceae bacterium]|nr:hypothetical protein [Steroidobacteraceae bacterium]